MTAKYPSAPLDTGPDGPGRPTETFDLRWVLAFFWRRIWVMAAVFLVVLAAAVGVYMSMPKVFSATSTVLLDRSKFNVVQGLENTSDPVLDSAAVDTEVQVLQSRDLAERVVNFMHLDQDPQFNPTLPGAPKPSPVVTFIKRLMPSGPPTPSTPVSVHTQVINNFLAAEEVKRVNLTYAIQIRFQAASPVTAAALANAIAQQYVAAQVDTKVAANQDASNLVQQRLGDLRGQVLDAETQAQQYRSRNGLLGTGISDQSITQQEISTLNTQLAAARADQAEKEAKLNTARQQLAAGSNGEDVGQALDSPVIANLRAQRAQVSREVADLRAAHGPAWPQLVSAQNQLADIEANIQAEIRRIVSGLDADAQVARGRTASLEASLTRAQGTLGANNNAQVKLDELNRNVDSVSSLYQSFLDRYKETTVQQGTERAEARVIGIAAPPRKPFSPSTTIFLGGGLIAATILALAFGLLMEAIENGLATSRDIERELELPALASIPELGSTLGKTARREALKDPARYVVDKPLSSFAESLRSLRASLSYSRHDRAVQVIAVTSALPGEGKTTTAVSLGRSYAVAGNSVVIVDADVRRPSLARVAGATADAGLMEVLRGEASLDAALVKDTVSEAWLLTAGSMADGDLLLTPKMDELLATLRKRFSAVVIDTAPVLPIAETRVLASRADAVLFLARWRRTPAQAVRAAINQLRSVDAPIAGVSLSNVDVRKQSRYGYGDPTFYYGSYKKYYAS